MEEWMIRQFDNNKVQISDINELTSLVNKLRDIDNDQDDLLNRIGNKLTMIKHKVNYISKVDASPARETVEINMGDCAIKFFNYNGDTAVTGDIIRPWMWQFVSTKVDPTAVRSVTIPTLRYDDSSNGPLKILVEIEPTL